MKASDFQLLMGVFFALTAVILGAFGAHVLKDVLSADQLDSFQTGIRYQMYHALLLIGMAWKGERFTVHWEPAITLCISLGVVLFSWSIYLLNLQSPLGFSAGWLGPITPLGGMLLISGWGLLLTGTIRNLRGKN